MSQNRIQALRKQRAWTQEQLAQCSGLSVRTIQRIENGEPAGAETLQALAAVFEVPVQDLQESAMAPPPLSASASPPADAPDPQAASQEAELRAQVEREARFWGQMQRFGALLVVLLIINLLTSPSYLWVKWVALGWGLALVSRALRVFQLFGGFGPVWQERRLQRLRAKT
ncbi:helix-turn-helix domain-containing protein [Silvimonas soli]|uniref:helix-turn-helix domain-containing protein n=1 Tax=Silvimonas soli TaxID=2980100 RepID=UPI0024B365A7|nr:helix-turn-helix domain-containing protein [Silvimonas soli]